MINDDTSYNKPLQARVTKVISQKLKLLFRCYKTRSHVCIFDATQLLKGARVSAPHLTCDHD